MKNKTSKIVSALYFLCIVTCVLLSAYLVSDVAARYFTEASGSDSARVAKFSVSAFVLEEQSDQLYIPQDATTANYKFTVKSKSEVAVVYDVVIVFPEVLPDSITLTLDNKQPTIDGTTYTFKNAGDFTVNGGEKQHVLTIIANKSVYKVEQSEIAVKIIAQQVD